MPAASFLLVVFSMRYLATIRRLHAHEDGEHISTKTGLSFGTKLLASLKEFLMAGTLFLRALELWTDKREESYEDGYKATVAKVRKELAVTLKCRYGNDINNGEIPLDSEWKDAEEL